MKKISDEVIIESYTRLKSVWKVGKEVGLCGQSVHERAVKLGILVNLHYQQWQIDFVKNNYNYYADRHLLNELSDIVIIDKPNTVRLAKKLGIKTNYARQKVNAKYKKFLYSTYMTMCARCNNPKNTGYKNYGGRGIKNCFYSIDDFIEKMASTYIPGLTLERVNCNGNYSHHNCIWANFKTQGNNKRNTILVTINGTVVKFNEECEKRGLKNDTIWKRIFKYKWSADKAFTEPIKKKV